jgi:hypothetical protein
MRCYFNIIKEVWSEKDIVALVPIVMRTLDSKSKLSIGGYKADLGRDKGKE